MKRDLAFVLGWSAGWFFGSRSDEALSLPMAVFLGVIMLGISWLWDRTERAVKTWWLTRGRDLTDDMQERRRL